MLVIGTKNEGKVKELNDLLPDIEVTGLRDDVSDVTEDRGTLQGNAIKKVTTYAKKMGAPTISDDTGLEVEALDGAPGVKTARFAGPDATIEENKELLLSKLERADDRSARWRTVIAYATPERGLVATFEGTCKGSITKEERGDGGFGYDPLFVPDDFEATFAEMSESTKNLLSHRNKSLQKFKDYYNDQA